MQISSGTHNTKPPLGKGRLKCKIQFSEETPKPVIKEAQVQKQTFDMKYKLGDVLGEGAHAVVKVGWNRKNNEKVAVKVFRTGDSEIINTIKRTFSNTRFLNHPNIVAEKELFINEQTETSFLVMEFCSFSSLESYLKQHQILNEQEIQLIAHDLLITLQYIHSKGICHRDIKPDNILLNIESLKNGKSPTIKLIDFGVSKRFLQIVPGKIGSEVSDMWTRTGNINYCAPEIFSGGGYNVGIDVWAVGIVLYQCLTGKLPFYKNSIMDSIELITNEIIVDHFLEKDFLKASLPLQNFLKQLLKKDPKQRIKVEDALKHPFLKLTHDLVTKSKDDQEIQSNNLKMMNGKALVQSHQLHDQQFLGISQKKNIGEVTEEDRKIQFQQNIHSFKEGTKLTEIQIVKRNNQAMTTIDLISSFNSYGKLENSRTKEEDNHKLQSQFEEIKMGRKDDPFSQMIQGNMMDSINVKDQDVKRSDSRLLELDKEFGCLVVQEEDEDL